jgi:hypothetical protein
MSLINRLRPSGGTIVATVALIAALAGTAYAAQAVITDSSQIKGRVINGQKMEKESVGGQAVREKSLKGVNAATLDKQTADDLKVRWLLLNEKGQIEEQSGGFTVLDAYQTNQNVYVDTGESLVGHGLSATIALQNLVDVDGAAGADPSFDGEVSVARCQVPNVVECAPANAKNVNALVVSPRNSDGTATAAGDRKRIYVEVTE